MKIDLEELNDKLNTIFSIVFTVVGIVIVPCMAILAILLAVQWCTVLLIEVEKNDGKA